MTLTVYSGAGSRLRLPVRPPRPEDADLSPFEPAEVSAPLAVEQVRSGERQKTVTRDEIAGSTTYRLREDGGRVRLEASSLETASCSERWYRIYDADPLSAQQRVRQELAYALPGEAWDVRIETVSTLSSDETHFLVTTVVRAYEGRRRAFVKSWEARIERDFV